MLNILWLLPLNCDYLKLALDFGVSVQQNNNFVVTFHRSNEELKKKKHWCSL